jgi:hypothetical protein
VERVGSLGKSFSKCRHDHPLSYLEGVTERTGTYLATTFISDRKYIQWRFAVFEKWQSTMRYRGKTGRTRSFICFIAGLNHTPSRFRDLMSISISYYAFRQLVSPGKETMHPWPVNLCAQEMTNVSLPCDKTGPEPTADHNESQTRNFASFEGLRKRKTKDIERLQSPSD